MFAAAAFAGAAITAFASPAAADDVSSQQRLHPCAHPSYAPGGVLLYNDCGHGIRVVAFSEGVAGDCVAIAPHGGPADSGLSRNSTVDKINDC